MTLHRFSMTFSNGDKLSLTVDLRHAEPAFTASPQDVVLAHREEYLQFVDTVVMPTVLNEARPEQLIYFVKRGLKALEQRSGT